MPAVLTGLDNLILNMPERLKGRRIGLLCNPASVNHRLEHARWLISRLPDVHLRTLFSPQHGFFSEKQDNMIESKHAMDPMLNLPVFSLYGETRIPDAAMLEPIDLLVVDLQDVGTRVYTFIYTMSYCMEAAKEAGLAVLVLDRPNPLGGNTVEGNCLSPAVRSFVGRYPIPMRHGLTIGELALMFNRHFDIGCDLEVIPMQGWRRDMLFHHTGLNWVAPSPNLPTPLSALVYPGQVLWEGTNVSEGRGTTQPFELFGAPYLDPATIKSRLPEKVLSGVILRDAAFEPTFNKWKGSLCKGFQIHVVDAARIRAFELGLALLHTVIDGHRDAFEWKKPPYEYELRIPPIDLILGSRDLRQRLQRLDALDDIISAYQPELAQFRRLKESFHLYP